MPSINFPWYFHMNITWHLYGNFLTRSCWIWHDKKVLSETYFWKTVFSWLYLSEIMVCWFQNLIISIQWESFLQPISRIITTVKSCYPGIEKIVYVMEEQFKYWIPAVMLNPGRLVSTCVSSILIDALMSFLSLSLDNSQNVVLL